MMTVQVNHAMQDPRFTRIEAAAYLGVLPKTLSNWASTGRYQLKFHKVGGRVIYLKSDLDKWIASRGTTQAGCIVKEAITGVEGDGANDCLVIEKDNGKRGEWRPLTVLMTDEQFKKFEAARGSFQQKTGFEIGMSPFAARAMELGLAELLQR
ncbi:helix-turn-helix domain-containing protein [Aeromonas caviae]|uniref:helix-turn-helix domain-containing protein n=1 Tax=Aeromonas caviae TaxID=648 RepID=UPI00388E8820